MRRLISHELRMCCSLKTAKASVSGIEMYAKELENRSGHLIRQRCENPKVKVSAFVGMWRALSLPRRKLYNERARVESAVSSELPIEDVVMFYLRRNKDIQRFFSHPSLIEDMSHAAAKHLSSRQKASLRKLFQLEQQNAFRRSEGLLRQTKEVVDHWTDMIHYNTFTEMLRVVAPTRKLLYIEVFRASSSEGRSRARAMTTAMTRYEQLSERDRSLFNPITDKESPKFERFCCLHCGGMNSESLDIIQLFSAFRNIKSLDTSPSTQACQEVYRSFLSLDNIHDSNFLRARRALSRVKARRSSDCGLYVFKHKGGGAVLPVAYTINQFPGLDDISVAEMLISTRNDYSVYDDVLERANCLRPPAHSKQLDGYRLQYVVSKRTEELKALWTEHQMKQKNTQLSKTIKVFLDRAAHVAPVRKAAVNRRHSQSKRKGTLAKRTTRRKHSPSSAKVALKNELPQVVRHRQLAELPSPVRVHRTNSQPSLSRIRSGVSPIVDKRNRFQQARLLIRKKGSKVYG